jgi:putative transposase
MIKYKAERNGIKFIKVNPAYTSKTCSQCGVVKEKLALSDREFICECGNKMDRDYNASINISRSIEEVEKK